MASPIPKRPSQRQRRNRTTSAATIEAPLVSKPSLPDGHAWHPFAVWTWDVWWASPIADEWVDADVPGLISLISLVDRLQRTRRPTDRARLQAEIRLSSREYGLSPMSRRTLQWEVIRVKQAEQAKPTPGPRRRSGRAVLSVLTGKVS